MLQVLKVNKDHRAKQVAQVLKVLRVNKELKVNKV